jgi:hypothetical protein
MIALCNLLHMSVLRNIFLKFPLFVFSENRKFGLPVRSKKPFLSMRVFSLAVLLALFIFSSAWAQPAMSSFSRLQQVSATLVSATPATLFTPKKGKERNYFNVALKNETVVKAYTRIDTRVVPHSVTILLGGEIKHLTPAETHLVSLLKDDGDEAIGIPTDTCWLFKMAKGALNIYTYLPYPDWNMVVALQKGEHGDIVRITAETLKTMIADNPKALQLFNLNKWRLAIEAYNGHWIHPDEFKNRRR